jgi:inorganic pyrophosphatase
VFPFDFGFVPSTLGDGGGPLGILVLMDAPAFTGCVVPSRLIGAIEAEHTEDGKTEKNDRGSMPSRRSRSRTGRFRRSRMSATTCSSTS